MKWTSNKREHTHGQWDSHSLFSSGTSKYLHAIRCVYTVAVILDSNPLLSRVMPVAHEAAFYWRKAASKIDAPFVPPKKLSKWNCNDCVKLLQHATIAFMDSAWISQVIRHSKWRLVGNGLLSDPRSCALKLRGKILFQRNPLVKTFTISLNSKLLTSMATMWTQLCRYIGTSWYWSNNYESSTHIWKDNCSSILSRIWARKPCFPNKLQRIFKMKEILQ